MPVHKSQGHGGDVEDIRNGYRNRAERDEYNPEGSAAMVGLIDRLDAGFPGTDIWLLTSHYHLVLMDAPTWDAGDWLVTVQGVRDDEYFMSYLMPRSLSPFPRPAEVHTTAKGIDQAMECIRTAMRESGGWITSTELGR
jgi:hypothetical protein